MQKFLVNEYNEYWHFAYLVSGEECGVRLFS
jgi:hypothetical protein